MTARQVQRDLVVLVADKNIEFALRGLLSRPQALGIRLPDYTLYVHPERDPGCLRKAAPFLRPYACCFRYALVVLDREGCGRQERTRAELETEIEAGLAGAGWENRAAAVVLDPELEAWIWSDSPEVDRVLGWAELPPLRTWLRSQGFTFSAHKPDRPKEAVEAALRFVRRPRSSAIFRELAERVSLERCRDPAFAKLRQCLGNWFPAEQAPYRRNTLVQ